MVLEGNKLHKMVCTFDYGKLSGDEKCIKVVNETIMYTRSLKNKVYLYYHRSWWILSEGCPPDQESG